MTQTDVITFNYIYPVFGKNQIPCFPCFPCTVATLSGLMTFWNLWSKRQICPDTLKMSAKCAQQSVILTYQIFCVLNPWSLQGSHHSLLPSISKHLEKITTLTDQIICTLKVSLCTFVCNNTGVMWPLFIEVIVSFCIKKHKENLCNTGKLRENTGNFILATKWPPCSEGNARLFANKFLPFLTFFVGAY